MELEEIPLPKSNSAKKLIDNASHSLPSLFNAANQLAKLGRFLERDEGYPEEDFTQIVDLNLVKVAQLGLGFSISEALPSGVLVAIILPDSTAEKNGLKSGDRILEINGENVESADRVQVAAIFKCMAFGPLSLKIHREHRFSGSAKPLLLSENVGNGDTVDSAGEKGRRYDVQLAEKKAVIAVRSTSVGQPSNSASSDGLILKASTSAGMATGLLTTSKGVPDNANLEKGRSQLDSGAQRSRLQGATFLAIFATEIAVGIAVIILECVSAGLFTNLIFGEEYVGIYVGVFCVLCGAFGMWTNISLVSKSKERNLFLANIAVNCLNAVNCLALLIASAVLLARHDSDRYTQIGVDGKPTNDLTHLIGLKGAVVALYTILFLTSMSFHIAVYLASKCAK